MNCNPTCITPALEDTVNTVLETMFFESAEPAELADRSALAWFAVDFTGVGAGTVYLGILPPAMHELAAAFAGLDAGPSANDQSKEAMLELANMVCGGTLSRLEPDGHFDLGAPRVCNIPPPPEIPCHAFQIAAGWLAVGLETRPAA
jgi:hypothetical protein